MAKILQYTQSTKTHTTNVSEMKFDTDFENEQSDKINVLNNFDLEDYISGDKKKYIGNEISDKLEFIFMDTAFNDDERPMTGEEFEELDDLIESVEEEISSCEIDNKKSDHHQPLAKKMKIEKKKIRMEKKQEILEELLDYIKIKQEENFDKSRAFNDWKQSSNEEYDDEEEAIEEYMSYINNQNDNESDIPGVDFEDDADDNEYNYSEDDKESEDDNDDDDDDNFSNSYDSDEDNSYQF